MLKTVGIWRKMKRKKEKARIVSVRAMRAGVSEQGHDERIARGCQHVSRGVYGISSEAPALPAAVLTLRGTSCALRPLRVLCPIFVSTGKERGRCV